ncbi:MAG: hypothetical protein ACP5QP_01760 [Brevinematia bacterium]
MMKEDLIRKLAEELKVLSGEYNDLLDEEEYTFFAKYIFDASEEEIYLDSFIESWPSWLRDWLITKQKLYQKCCK